MWFRLTRLSVRGISYSEEEMYDIKTNSNMVVNKVEGLDHAKNRQIFIWKKVKKKNLTTDKHVRPLCSYLWENLATFARIQLYIANGILKGFRGL